MTRPTPRPSSTSCTCDVNPPRHWSAATHNACWAGTWKPRPPSMPPRRASRSPDQTRRSGQSGVHSTAPGGGTSRRRLFYRGGVLLRSGEVDIRVEAVGRVVARHEVSAARVDDVEPAHRVEADLEEVTEDEVALWGHLDRIDECVRDGTAELRRGAGVHVPVPVDVGVGLVAD